MAESTVSATEAGLWPDSIEKKFITFLLEEAINGKTPYKWEVVTVEFNNQNEKSYSSKQIQDKYKRLKGRFKAFTHLLGRPDMKYDTNTNTFTGSDMAWSNAIKVHSRCVDFRKKGMAYYPLLKELFLRGAPASSSQQVGATYVDKQKNISKDKQATYSDTSTGKKRKAESSLYRVAGSLKTIQSDDRYSMDKAMKIMSSFPDLDINTELNALEKLEKLEKRIVFIDLPREKQYYWIERAGRQQ
nr:l10-interacting myb domain-containing protein [Quercus suber]